MRTRIRGFIEDARARVCRVCPADMRARAINQGKTKVARAQTRAKRPTKQPVDLIDDDHIDLVIDFPVDGAPSEACSTTTILAQLSIEPDAGAGAVHTITPLRACGPAGGSKGIP